MIGSAPFQLEKLAARKRVKFAPADADVDHVFA
jgi:hypothetical protein